MSGHHDVAYARLVALRDRAHSCWSPLLARWRRCSRSLHNDSALRRPTADRFFCADGVCHEELSACPERMIA